ncbi:MAG: hypothetical protein LBF16_01035 [Pseudomonadales bacterium]|nr:hypothetical protein [Pseudomonadales bacterium]
MFEFYALSAKLDLPEGTPCADVMATMQGKVVGIMDIVLWIGFLHLEGPTISRRRVFTRSGDGFVVVAKFSVTVACASVVTVVQILCVNVPAAATLLVTALHHPVLELSVVLLE